MGSKSRLARAQQGDRYFRWRGGDVSRLEALTDAVFALAMTLLVVSLEVPHSFAELEDAFRLLPAFAVCFALLLYIWFSHHRFHRRYGLEDGLTLTLNGVLLFLVLSYVYPLKFLFYAMFSGALGQAESATQQPGEVQRLMIYYGVGVIGIVGVLWLLHRLAWARREALELTPVERELTQAALHEHAISVAIASLSITLAALDPRNGALSGLIYFLMPVAQSLNGWRHGRRVEKLAADAEADGGKAASS